MNEPPKKPIKTVRKGALIAICAALAVVCAVTLILLNRPRTPVEIESYDTSVTLSSRALEDIVSVHVQNEDDSFTCLYNGQTLTLEQDPSVALLESNVQKLLDCSQSIVVRETVLDTASLDVSLADFGLDAPRLATITYKDGATVTLRIGALTPAEIPSHYMMMDGDTRLFTIDTDFYDTFGLTAEALRDFEQLHFDAELIDAVSIFGDITLEAVNNGEFWQMTAPYRYPIDAARAQTLLANIENMRFATCLGSADALDLAAYGLDSPVLTLSVKQARSYALALDESGQTVTSEIPETTYTIALGDMRGDTMYYLLYAGNVYTSGILTTSFLTSLSVENLLNRNPVSFPENKLTSLTLSRGDETTRYTVSLVETVLDNNELETDEYGNIVYRFSVLRDGAKIDSEAFLTWYAKLVSMQAQGWAKEEEYAEKEAAYAIDLTTEKQSRSLVMTPYDSKHFACQLDGVTLFYVDGDLDALYSERP